VNVFFRATYAPEIDTCIAIMTDTTSGNINVSLQVDFIWINRDQKAFEWFVGILDHIETEQIGVAYDENKEPEKVIDMHMYMTAAQGKTDMKGIGLQIALDLLHKKDNIDLITGLQTRTQAGRPNWNQV
jgi:hypothetical protein